MKNILLSFIFILSLTAFSACEKAIETTEENTKLKIITTFYPLEFLLNELWWEKAEIVNLSWNQWVHSYSPSPQDLVKIHNSDLFVFVWESLEPWVEDLEASLTWNQTFEVSSEIQLEKPQERSHEEHEKDHEESSEENHEADKDEHHHDHWDLDPHFWLSPVLMKELAEKTEARLSVLDSENSEFYKNNLEILSVKLDNLENSYKSDLKKCENEALISHDAFGYIERAYSLRLHPISGLSHKDEPSAKILAELKEEAKEWVEYVLVEEWNVEDFAKVLASETWIKTLKINPMGKWVSDWDNYFSVMRENLENFKISLNCN